MKSPNNSWFKSVVLPAITAVAVCLLGFGLHNCFVVQPDRLEGRVDSQMTRLIDNIDRVRNHIKELEQEDKLVGEERNNLDKIEWRLDQIDNYSKEGEFKQILGEIEEANKVGRESFPDVWLLYPQPGKEEVRG